MAHMVPILRYIDKYIFGTLTILTHRLKYLSPKPADKQQKILIIRLRTLGSSILTFPMVKQCKQAFPDAQIDLLHTRRSSVYLGQKYFHHTTNLFSLQGVRYVLKNRKTYDIIIDTEDYFHTSTLATLWMGKKSYGYNAIWTRKRAYTHPITYDDTQHAVLTFLDLLKPITNTQTPTQLEPVHYSTKHKQQAHKLTKNHQDKIKVCLHTAGAETAPDRFRSPEHRTQLIQLIYQNYGEQVILFLSGTQSEHSTVQKIISNLNPTTQTIIADIVGQTCIPTLAALLTQCDIMIANDTGTMHLAAAMDTTTIGLFGPNLPERFGPYPATKHTALYQGQGQAYINVHKGQFLPDPHKRVNHITPQQVYERIQHHLSQKGYNRNHKPTKQQ